MPTSISQRNFCYVFIYNEMHNAGYLDHYFILPADTACSLQCIRLVLRMGTDSEWEFAVGV